MKRPQPLTFDPVLAAQRAERRAARRAAAGPRPEDVAREKRREAAQTGNQPRATLERKPTATTKRRRPISECSPEQRAAVANRACVVCREQPTDPAHLVPRGLCADTDGHPLAVIPLCRGCHRSYDEGGLDLLPYLEPHWREHLAFAVSRFGLISTLRRVTNDRNAAASVYPSMKP